MTRINHNIASMISQYSLRVNDRDLNTAIEQLSTGLRINRASDDAANLSVSEQLRAVIRGTDVVSRNAMDATSLLQIAEGALNESASLLQRMRDLAVQASNETWTSTDRAYMDLEFQGLKDELNRIAYQTQYNNLPLLSGETDSFGSVGGPSVIHVGVNNEVGVDTMTVSMISVTTGALGLVTANILDSAATLAALDNVDEAIFNVSESRSSIGAMMTRLESAVTNLSVQEINVQAAESAIRDTDFAKMSTEMVRSQIMSQSALSMLTQANNLPQSVLSLFNGGS